MPDSIYKVIELIGTSTESWEKANRMRWVRPGFLEAPRRVGLACRRASNKYEASTMWISLPDTVRMSRS